MNQGISLVLCCHNSAERLPQTLAHLAAQHVPDDLNWEIIVVDNASADHTAQMALNCWPSDHKLKLRIVRETQLGLSHARSRGFLEAKYDVVSFIDDDNWVCPEWVQIVSEVMAKHPEVGVCGGLIEAAYDMEPPWWFERFKDSYVIGPQGEESGDISNTRGWLCGAGMSVRKEAYRQLVSKGFQPSLVGRLGKILSAGEDKEICFALRLAGWKLWYEPRLRLQHFLPAHRLSWTHLRQLHRGYGAQEVRLFPYHLALNGGISNAPGATRRVWRRKFLRVLRSLGRFRMTLLKLIVFRRKLEGDSVALDVEQRIGFLNAFLQTRGGHEQMVREIQVAPWRKSSS